MSLTPQILEPTNSAAKLMLDERIGYRESMRIFRDSLIDQALLASDGVERRAAMILGVSNSWLNRIRREKDKKTT